MKINQHIFNKFKIHEFDDEQSGGKVIKWFNDNISSPENRFILGATALATQPFFDLYNKEVDEKTRTISCARTIAKIIAGTLTGVAIRASYIHLTKNLSAVGKLGAKTLIDVGRAGQTKTKEIIITKARQLFTPSAAKAHDSHEYKQYQNTIGTGLAIITMVLTNFIIDAPLTKFLTNKIHKRIENPEENTSNKSKEVVNG